MNDAGVHAAASESWDAVVIGAGVAGSTCAHAIASGTSSGGQAGAMGRRVLLVERSVMPRDKVCGCCLAPAGVELLREAGLGAVLEGAMRIDVCELRVGMRSATLPARGFHVLGRDVLDFRLAAAAQAAGASVLTGWSARVQTDGTVKLRRGTNGAVKIRTRAIIVADGMGGSSLAERPEFGWRVWNQSRMGIGATLTRSPVPLPTRHMVMLCGRFGYLGLVRLPTGEIDAAASLDPVAARAAGGPAKLCDEIVASVGGDSDALGDALWRGTPLLTRRRKRVESGNVYVVGDAAAYVEPFTGEGMTWAIRGSLIAAEIIASRLADCAVLGGWATAHRREFAREHRRCGLVAQLARYPRMLQAALAIGACVPAVLNRVACALGPKCHEVHEGRGA